MGIHQLMKLIGDNASGAIKENEIKNYFGRKIAIDASMALYQFLIAIRPGEGGNLGLTDADGETTSHLQGMFHRTIRMISHGIKPIFVFDGKAPEMKSDELQKRRQKREEAEEELKKAEETGDQEALARFSKRIVRVTQKHNDECKRLLKLMGVPIIEAPGEAEAQCAAMSKAGLVYATGTEDMDALTFGSPILLRHLTFSEARKMPIREVYLSKVLEELNLTQEQFVDLCILLGCDYCDSIRGIGPVRALEMIRKYGNIETILKHLDKSKFVVPENFDYVSVRKLFSSPQVSDCSSLELKWNDPDEEGLVEFLVKEKNFNEERVRQSIEKLKKSRNTSVQGRLTSFFGEPIKRKREDDATPSPKSKKPKIPPKLAKIATKSSTKSSAKSPGGPKGKGKR
jgi:flap endonuclease-1